MPFTGFFSFTDFSFRDFSSFPDFSFTDFLCPLQISHALSRFLLYRSVPSWYARKTWCYKKYTERLIDRFPVLEEEFCSLIPFTGGGTISIKFIPKTCILSQLVAVSTSPPVGKDHMLLWVEKSNVFYNQEEHESGGINFKGRKRFLSWKTIIHCMRKEHVCGSIVWLSSFYLRLLMVWRR